MPDETLVVTTTIDAPAEAVFAILTNPTKHPAIDGTGWVDKPVDTAQLTEVGQVFRMGMYFDNPDVSGDGHYQIWNLVETLDTPHAIGWKPGQPDAEGVLQFGGWTWRYDLVASGPNATEVTLTYDWSQVPPQVRESISFPPFPTEHLTNSLQHLATLATSARV